MAGIRLVPLAELYLAYPRELDATSRYIPPHMLGQVFLGTHPPDLSTAGGPYVRAGESWMYWVSAGFFVGPLALLLALAGVFSRKRAALAFAAIGLVWLWLTFGTGVRPSLWDALRWLPVLRSMQAPERLILLVGFALSLCAGFGFEAAADQIARRVPGKGARLACVAGLLLMLVGPMLWVNAPLSRAAFVLPTAEVPARDSFRQVRIPPRPEQWGGELYGAVMSNLGNVEGSSDIPSRSAVRAETDQGYRGEVFLLRQTAGVTAQITPNVITIHAQSAFPDLLVVNQNYFPGWRAEGSVNAPVRSDQGRLSLPIPAGTHDVTLRYGAGPLWRGLAFSMAGLIAAFLYVRMRAQSALRREGALGALTAVLMIGLLSTVWAYADERGLPQKQLHRGGAFRGPSPK
jgi:hypothetical protein